MPILDPTQWLLIGLTLPLIALLCISTARRQYWKRIARGKYRTANGTLIERQSAKILQHPMATRRATFGHQVPPFRPPGSTAPTTLINVAQLEGRGVAAALHDMGHGGVRKPGPYTVGTLEHMHWSRGYNRTFRAKVIDIQTVQTSALSDA